VVLVKTLIIIWATFFLWAHCWLYVLYKGWLLRLLLWSASILGLYRTDRRRNRHVFEQRSVRIVLFARLALLSNWLHHHRALVHHLRRSSQWRHISLWGLHVTSESSLQDGHLLGVHPVLVLAIPLFVDLLSCIVSLNLLKSLLLKDFLDFQPHGTKFLELL